MPATALLTTTLPTIVATGVTGAVAKRAFGTRGGKAVGTRHYHYKGRKAVSHRHEGGHIAHYHKGLVGYGKTKATLRR